MLTLSHACCLFLESKGSSLMSVIPGAEYLVMCKWTVYSVSLTCQAQVLLPCYLTFSLDTEHPVCPFLPSSFCTLHVIHLHLQQHLYSVAFPAPSSSSCKQSYYFGT